jgi:hypothetical protein
VNGNSITKRILFDESFESTKPKTRSEKKTTQMKCMIQNLNADSIVGQSVIKNAIQQSSQIEDKYLFVREDCIIEDRERVLQNRGV